MSRTCPKCGSDNITYQTFQENKGGKTVTRTKSKYKEKRHGCLWWGFIGWWWWIIEIFLWIFLSFLGMFLFFVFLLFLNNCLGRKYKKKKNILFD